MEAPPATCQSSMDNHGATCLSPSYSHSHPNPCSSLPDSCPPQSSEKQQSQPPSGQPKFSNGPHIRSRITVVCAECKRLKLKCDRRTPCSSCLKRDTVQRCVYSQAAAEKIDVQSLHNRLLVVEGTLAQLSSAPPSTPISSAFSNLPPFKSSYPSQSLPAQSAAPGSSAHANISTSSLPGLPCNDRALLATGASGSSVVINLEDVSSIWIKELDLAPNSDSAQSQSSSLATSAPYTGTSLPNQINGGKTKVKLEPTPVVLPPSSPALSNSSVSTLSSSYPGGQASFFIPPLPYTTFLPSCSSNSTSNTAAPSTPSSHSSSTLHSSPPSSHSHYPASHLSYQNELPQVTPALMSHLPAPAHRSRLMQAFSETMVLHPCFNVRHFERRVEAMIAWAESGASFNPNAGEAGEIKRRELAREIFGLSTSGKKTNATGSASPKPTLSFFATAAAAFALGALVAHDNGESSHPNSSNPAGEIGGSPTPNEGSNPAALYALSEQALDLFEKTSPYDVDSVVAMILQVLFRLHEDRTHVSQAVFPLIGKMTNVARMMGLSMDPDEFPGTYTLFEAETRRRVWWDVFYYDLFVSDCMGHPPLIADNSFTTKLPADVDEEAFNPSSATVPVPVNGDGSDKDSMYFILKCRLAQLVKSVKKQTFRDPASEESAELSIDQAASFEAEVSTWLGDLPPRYRLDLNSDISQAPVLPSIPPTLLAQRCELLIVANRIILKLYLPFLKDSSVAKPSHQAVLGTINAAHSIIHASRLLHSVWRTSRPATFDFYDFGRTLFDAAIVCAHAIVQQPSSILASEALKGVNAALEVMRDLDSAKADGMYGNQRTEALRIIEMMKRKAEMARNGSAHSEDPSLAGSKRKRQETEDDTLDSGFQLPFVGASVTSANTESSRAIAPLPRSTALPSKDIQGSSQSGAPKPRVDASKPPSSKDKAIFPTPIGVRARPPQGRLVRQRTGSASPAPTPPPTSSRNKLPVQVPSHLPPPHVPPQVLTVPEHSNTGYPFPSQGQSQPMENHPHHHMMPHQEGYPAYDNRGDPNADARRFSHSGSFDNSPQPNQGFEPMANSPYTPPHDFTPSYSSGPSSDGYYYPPEGPPQTFEHTAINPEVVLAQEYSMPPPAQSMDASVPSTPIEQNFMIPPENRQAPPYMQPQMGKSAPPPQNMGLQYPSGAAQPVQVNPAQMQGWAPQGNQQMWMGYNKYYPA